MMPSHSVIGMSASQLRIALPASVILGRQQHDAVLDEPGIAGWERHRPAVGAQLRRRDRRRTVRQAQVVEVMVAYLPQRPRDAASEVHVPAQ